MDGKVAVVTGASRGIGAAIAQRFAAEGARIAIVARTLEEDGRLPGSLSATAERIRDRGGEVLAICADLADAQSRAEIVTQVLAQFGRLDILVNNAAWARFKPTHEMASAHVRLGFEVNLFAPLDLACAAVPAMAGQGGGWILNISSGTSLHPKKAPFDTNDRYFQFHQGDSPTIYGTTKAALERLTTGMAAELFKANIAVNTLAPVEAVASEGAVRMKPLDEGISIEPVEAMAEAALALCSRPPADLSGRNAVSLALLDELGIGVHTLDGQRLLEAA